MNFSATHIVLINEIRELTGILACHCDNFVHETELNEDGTVKHKLTFRTEGK